MTQTSEYVALGHPDKVADHISSFLLDEYLRRDPKTRYAVECQIKDNAITLGGEVTSAAEITDKEIRKIVRAAIIDVGYTREYCKRWPDGATINPDRLKIAIHIGRQSANIAQGVDRGGWGDQGIFWGMATPDEETGNMPRDHWLAKRLGQFLYEHASEFKIGIDIKTQVTLVDGMVSSVIVAAPMLDDDAASAKNHIRRAVRQICDGFRKPIINGTGAYVIHASVGDCGTTGRKLAVDFYGGNCRIGGGSPWTKDGTKADVALNILAREIALAHACSSRRTRYVALSCCIGSPYVNFTIFDEQNAEVKTGTERRPCGEVVRLFRLNTPVYAYKNRHGIFELPTAK